jgi:hypothetical protein
VSTAQQRRRAADGKESKKKHPDLWSHSAGRRGLSVFGTERSLTDQTIRVRYTDPTSGKKKWITLDDSVTVRNDKGKKDRDLEAKAKTQVEKVYEAVRDGKNPEQNPDILMVRRLVRAAAAAPAASTGTPSSAVGSSPAPAVAEQPLTPAELAARRTVRQGIDIVVDPRMGKLKLADGQRSTERRNEWVSKLRLAERCLGPDTVLAHVGVLEYEALWRQLAETFKDTDVSGFRTTVRVTSALSVAMQWLRNRKLIPAGAATPPEKWEAELRNQWEALRGQPVPTPAALRHTREEAGKILGAVDDARVDPRMRLLIELGAELRGGQVVRARRRDVDLTRHPHAPHGIVRIAGNKKKPGTTVALTERQRAVLDASLSGYLREYEAAFVTGQVADYPLFPSKSLRADGVARPRANVKSLTASGLRTMWKVLEEEVAGVRHQPGRGWYGLRRIFTDVTRQVPAERAAKNLVSSHGLASGTREDVYMNPEDPTLLQESLGVRQEARRLVGLSAVPIAADPSERTRVAS